LIFMYMINAMHIDFEVFYTRYVSYV
jgi:hypothetical protein